MNGLEQMAVHSCLEQGRGRGVITTGEKWKVRLKNTIETDKDKIKERIQERKKWQFHSLKAVEKLVPPNPFLLISNKAPKEKKKEKEKRKCSN